MNIETELKNVEQTLWRIEDVCPYGSEVDLAVRDAIRAVRNAITTEHEYRTGIKSSKKPIKSADKHFNYDECLGDIYDSDRSNADNWSREEYNKMVETARGIFYPAVQKAADACHFTVSDNEAEYVAEKCVRCFFDNASWDEAVNRPEEYYVNSSFNPGDEVLYTGNMAKNLKCRIVRKVDKSEIDYRKFNPDAGDYYEIQFDSKLLGPSKQIAWEGRLKPLNSSRRTIKSSLEDRLIPYLEEFEEGYADALASTDEMGPDVRLDTFYEIFKSDYNLSDDDINKLKDSVEGIWKESKEM